MRVPQDRTHSAGAGENKPWRIHGDGGTKRFHVAEGPVQVIVPTGDENAVGDSVVAERGSPPKKPLLTVGVGGAGADSIGGREETGGGGNGVGGGGIGRREGGTPATPKKSYCGVRGGLTTETDVAC